MSGWLDESNNYVFITFLLINRNYVILRLAQFSGLRRSKCDILSLDLLKTTHFSYTEIGNYPDDFKTFEQDMQFWYTGICNFYDDFVFYMQFWSGGYFAFSWYPIKKNKKHTHKKPDSTDQCSTLSMARNNKNLKILKYRLTQKLGNSNDLY